MGTVKEYDAKIDARKRVTLRGARYAHYHVKEYEDGRIVMEPRELTAPMEISRRTLEMLDASMANLKQGRVSDPVALSAFLEEG